MTLQAEDKEDIYMKKLLALIMTGVMCALSGCGDSGAGNESSAPTQADNTAEVAEATEPAELIDCKLSYVTWVGIAPWFIAQEKGFFEANGLNVDLTLIEDETTYTSLYSTNQIQAGGCVLDSFVFGNASGANTVCPMALDGSVGGDGIIAAEGINSITDLKGKTVALDKSSTPYYFFNLVLRDNGMTEEDVTIMDMTSGDAGSAFLGGSVDAAVVWEPWLTNASQREGGHVLVSTVDYPTSIVDGLIVTNQFYNEHPEGVEALKKSWFEAVEYYNANIDEGDEIMAKGLGVEVSEFKDMVSKVKYFDEESNAEFFNKENDDNIYKTIDEITQFWKEKGSISADYSAEGIVVE